MLRIVLPKGSLERATLELFAAADLAVERSSDVDYRGRIADPRVLDVHILRPQEIPLYLERGLFDLGITGRDWIEETGAKVVSLGRLAYSKATSRPIRLVLATAPSNGSPSGVLSRPTDEGGGASGGSDVVGGPQDVAAGGLPGPAAGVGPGGHRHDAAALAGLVALATERPLRVATEYPELTRRWLAEMGIPAEVSYSYGATEAKVPKIADAVVELTETGRALRAAGLIEVTTLLESWTELVASPEAAADPVRAHAMRQLKTLLDGALEARGKVLVKLNVADSNLADVIGVLPSMKSPTVSELFGERGYAVETVVDKEQINTLIPALKDAGATDILELVLSKIVR